jgi:hypothetical protein
MELSGNRTFASYGENSISDSYKLLVAELRGAQMACSGSAWWGLWPVDNFIEYRSNFSLACPHQRYQIR